MDSRFKRSWFKWLPACLAVLFLVSIYVVPVSAGPGITAHEIILGQSCVISGPLKDLGTEMRDGALTYFNYINTMGGIKGRKIRLISMDDGYNAARCRNNTVNFIDVEQVFLLFGYVGTPTSKAALPLAVQKKVPFFAPYTGAEFLRTPVNPLVFNIRASYFQETEAIVGKLHSEKGIQRISVFYMNGSYGRAGLEGVQRALAKRNLTLNSKASYEVSTGDATAAARKLAADNPEAVIIVGTYGPAADFIAKMRTAGSTAYIVNISPVGGEKLAKKLGNQGVGVMITQVVPFPYFKRSPLVKEYHSLTRQFFPRGEASFTGMEGFIAAKSLCKILEAIPGEVNRTRFVKAAQAQANVDLGGLKFSFKPGEQQGAHDVFFTQIVPGGFVQPVTSLDDLYEVRGQSGLLAALVKGADHLK